MKIEIVASVNREFRLDALRLKNLKARNIAATVKRDFTFSEQYFTSAPMKRVAVILSGCGVYDGAEIHESVLTLLALDKAGAEVTAAAPDIDQYHVVNHQTGEVAEQESRNVQVESARIARGPVASVADIKPDDFDAVVLPGGFGAAKNLSSFAVEGAQCSVDESVAECLRRFHEADKPIGFACISPAIAAKIFGNKGVRLTIGTDAETAAALETNAFYR